MASKPAKSGGTGETAPKTAVKPVAIVVLKTADGLGSHGEIRDRDPEALKAAGFAEGVHWRRAKARDLTIAGRR